MFHNNLFIIRFSGDLRLIGGTNYGRLEIYHSSSWGSICDDGFTKNNAIVACRQMKLR